MSEQNVISTINTGFTEVHKRLDRFAEIQNDHNTKIALHESKFHVQPCEYLSRQVDHHPDKRDLQGLIDAANREREDIRSVVLDFLKGAVKVAFAAVMGALGYKVFGGQ